ncbi:hypothetical protein [Rhizobacter sp. OV335]|uniref:hypothetical protein n=1 Tax=Rhizobacter sp. OV335 TaxID=1500264 RepID=UPI00091EC8D3|nr:hypothetical protein [Rhizobacter sp. OV335]SHN34747.1 hypothetical protein SAMN02787076_05403 [Rhizobacter sp. OV335]
MKKLVSPRKILSGVRKHFAKESAGKNSGKRSQEKKNAADTLETGFQLSKIAFSRELVVGRSIRGLPNVPTELLEIIHAYKYDLERPETMDTELEHLTEEILSKITEHKDDPLRICSTIEKFFQKFQSATHDTLWSSGKEASHNIIGCLEYLALCVLNHDAAAAINEIDRVRQLTWRAVNPGERLPITLTSERLSTKQSDISENVNIQVETILRRIEFQSFGRIMYADFRCELQDHAKSGIDSGKLKRTVKTAQKKKEAILKMGYKTEKFQEHIDALNNILKADKAGDEEIKSVIANILKCSIESAVRDRKNSA